MLKFWVGIFKPNCSITLLTGLAVFLFLKLGFWQLQRAEEKERLLQLNRTQNQKAAVILHGKENLKRDSLRYRRVIVRGIWDSQHQFLLDNRVFQGRAGYEVLTPLVIVGSGNVVLVNRGWVPGNGDRSQLPDVALSGYTVTVRGMADRFPEQGMYLQGMSEPTPTWPAVVQQVKPEVISKRLKKPVMDFQIKMDSAAPDGYIRNWQLNNLNQDRHKGYALQWFLFAGIALALWFRHGMKEARSNKNEVNKSWQNR